MCCFTIWLVNQVVAWPTVLSACKCLRLACHCAQINFLPHEDIDGLFGVLANKLASMNVFTPQRMIDVFLGAQRLACKTQHPSDRQGLGVIHGHLPTDQFDSRITSSVPDWHRFFARPVSFSPKMSSIDACAPPYVLRPIVMLITLYPDCDLED